MASRKARLTKRTVDALKPGEIVWDTDVRGFGVRCQRASRVYILKSRVHGRQRWFSIGPHGSPWTPEMARREALSILGEIAGDRDPARERDASKRNPTVEKLASLFLAEHVEAKRKPRTAEGYRDLLERLTLPVLGLVKTEDVTHGDIAKLHHKFRGTPYQANRMLAVLSKMFGWAEGHGYRPRNTNPCQGIEKYREESRERFLSEAEIGTLADALNEVEGQGAESPYVIAAIRLLLFTGARLGEILNLRWSDVAFDNAMLVLPDSKTGKKVIYLSAPALEVLNNLPRLENNPYVIVGEREGARLINLQKPWRRIRARAGLEDVRLHDLRHSFASIGAMGGLSLPMVGKLLGHSQSATTERYAHLAADPVRAANEAIGQRIAAAMNPPQDNDVVASPERIGKGQR